MIERLPIQIVSEAGRKRVARLMRAASLVGISPRKARFTTVRDPIAGDVVQRNFTALAAMVRSAA